jgi:peptidyl-prolyl cis-trans isomerase A (cyclophilin A)
MTTRSKPDSTGFAPFGEVIEGMEVIDALNTSHGGGLDQGRIQMEGNAYLKSAYADLDYIKKATIVK